jgi:hypothetical protein
LVSRERGASIAPELIPGPDVPWRRATELLATGRPGAAADVLAGIGARTIEAEVRLHAARMGEADALAQLEAAAAFWRSVGADARLAEVERVRATVNESAS